MVYKNFEYVIHPEVTLHDWQDLKIQELTTPTPPPPTTPDTIHPTQTQNTYDYLVSQKI